MGLLVSGQNPAAIKTAERNIFTATAGQTSFTITQGYQPGDIDVYLNGIRLVDTEDYIALNGSTVVLNEAATLGDSVVVVCFYPFSVASHYTKSESDTRYVNAGGSTMSGKLINESGVDLPNGHIGFNRNVSNGVIYDNTSSAFQLSLYKNIHSTPNTLAIEAYNSLGNSIGNPFEVTSDNNTTNAIHRLKTLPSFVAKDNQISNTRAIASTNISQYFTTVDTNIGGCYNSSNGRFTAPISGYYIFGWNLFTTGVSADAVSRVGIRVNDVDEWSGGDRVGQANQGVIGIRLNRNDYVNLGTQNGSYTAYWYSTSMHSRFWGYLVG